MKTRIVLVALVLVIGLVFSGTAFAKNDVVVDLDKLSSKDAAEVLELQKMAKGVTNTATTTETVEKWANIGEKIGRAIAATCRELSVQVNEFIKTPVGKMTIAVILWKAIGKDLWHIVGGILAWITITSIILWSFSYFHMSKKITEKDKEGNQKIRYEDRYSFVSSDARITSAACHFISFVAITLVCMLIVFL